MKMTDSKFINYAHRGASSYAPENTFAAFYKGIEMGANGIETDIQQTRDGILVLHHDDTLERITGIRKKVSDLKFEELRKIDFGSFFSHKYENERIVTLFDFLSYFGGKRLFFALEIKQKGIEEKVVEMCRTFLNKSRYYITSFDIDCILKLSRSSDSINLGYLAEKYDSANVELLSKAGVAQYCPYAPHLDQHQMNALRSKGFNIRAWGVTDKDIMIKALRLGIDGMTVNFPDILYAELNN